MYETRIRGLFKRFEIIFLYEILAINWNLEMIPYTFLNTTFTRNGFSKHQWIGYAGGESEFESKTFFSFCFVQQQSAVLGKKARLFAERENIFINEKILPTKNQKIEGGNCKVNFPEIGNVKQLKSFTIKWNWLPGSSWFIFCITYYRVKVITMSSNRAPQNR